MTRQYEYVDAKIAQVNCLRIAENIDCFDVRNLLLYDSMC